MKILECLPTKKNLEELGKVYGMLTCLEFKGRDIKRNAIFKWSCSCGNIKNIDWQKVKNKSTRSCGCLLTIANKKKRVVGQGNTLPIGVSMMNKHYRQYKRSAEKRNYEFKLSRDQFEDIVKLDCVYCGESPRVLPESNHNFRSSCKANGVDRINNKLGYVKGNVVPCCKVCNIMKNDKTIEQFINKIRSIHEYFKLG